MYYAGSCLLEEIFPCCGSGSDHCHQNVKDPDQQSFYVLIRIISLHFAELQFFIFLARDQRLGVENLMKKAFANLTGDLAGTYYPLTGMEEKVNSGLGVV